MGFWRAASTPGAACPLHGVGSASSPLPSGGVSSAANASFLPKNNPGRNSRRTQKQERGGVRWPFSFLDKRFSPLLCCSVFPRHSQGAAPRCSCARSRRSAATFSADDVFFQETSSLPCSTNGVLANLFAFNSFFLYLSPLLSSSRLPAQSPLQGFSDF